MNGAMNDAMNDAVNDDALLELADEVEEIAYSYRRGEEPEGLEAEARALPVGARLRAELLRAASDWWLTYEQPDDARRCAEDAVADGGPTWVDPRTSLLSVLLRVDPDPARLLESALRAELPRLPQRETTLQLVGEDLQRAGWHEEAVAWFTLGLGDADPETLDAQDDVAAYLLTRRAESRAALELPEDRWDEAGRRVTRERDEWLRVEEGDWGYPSLVDESVSLDDQVLLFWPPEEYAAVVARWPELAAGYGGTADAHRERSEAHLRRRAENSPRVSVVAGSLTGLLELAESEQLDADSGAARAEHAARRFLADAAVRWPPGRNAPCWCGSGRKYKQCCGKPGQ